MTTLCEQCGAGLLDAASCCGACGARQTNPTDVPSVGASEGFTPPASLGIQPNVAAALSYLAGFVTGIVFLVIEPGKSDRFVRFHSFQSIFFNVAWIGFWIVWLIAGFLLGDVTKGLFFLLQLPVNLLLSAGGFCLWAFLIYNAYLGKTFKIPVIGSLAARQAGLQF